MAANIPPPDNEEGFAFTYTPDVPPIDDKELRLYIIKGLLDIEALQQDIPTRGVDTVLEKVIIPAAVRIEAYITTGK